MRSVRDIPMLENIPVLVRTSLNVPVENGVVTELFRLKQALPTIKFLQERYARTILISHITGTGTETLRPMYDALKRDIPNLEWCGETVGETARMMIRRLPPGGVVLLENLRRNTGEEENDPEFARELSMLADVFVEDSFDVCHREHASVIGVPTLLPSYAGFTVEAEVQALTAALAPARPSLAVIAGAKFSTKEPVISKLLEVYDHVFVGGALANDFLKAKGYALGSSLVSGESGKKFQDILTHPKLILPVDAIVAPPNTKRDAGRVASLFEIHEDAVVDVGPGTSSALTDLVNSAKTVLWNGPLGRYEDGFMDGTTLLARAIAAVKTHSVVGGGDTIAAIEKLGLSQEFSFISTGGGAMLDFLAYGTLPGLEVLNQK